MQRTKRIKPNLIIRIAFVCAFIFLFVAVINLQVEMNELREMREIRAERVQQLQDDVDELEFRIAEPVNDEVIKKIARELGLSKKNAIIYVYDTVD